MNRNFLRQSAWVMAVLMVLSACASQKEPAQQAIAAAESAIEGISEEAAKYVPEQLQELQSSLAAVKQSFDKGDYKSVLSSAPALVEQSKSVLAAAEAKKTEIAQALTQQWNSISGGIQPMLDAINSRVEILSKSRKLPKGLDQATFDAAKSGLLTAQQTWTEASAAFTSGQLESAVSKAQATDAKAREVLAQLGMTPAG